MAPTELQGIVIGPASRIWRLAALNFRLVALNCRLAALDRCGCFSLLQLGHQVGALFYVCTVVGFGSQFV